MFLPYFSIHWGVLFHDELLGAGHSDVGGRVGGRLESVLEAEILAGYLEYLVTAAQGLVGHVPGEGDMDEFLRAELLGRPDDGVAAGHEIVREDHVGAGALDDEGILVGLAGEEEDVGPLGLDPLEGLGAAGDGLVDDDGLHEGVVREGDYGGDEGLLLGHEIVRDR